MFKLVKDVEFLRQKSTPVLDVAEAKELISNLQSVLSKSDEGIGLSAIQIGIPKRLSLIKHRGIYISLINPVVVENDEEFVFTGEGCLSIPGVYVDTVRYRHFVIDNNVIDEDKFRVERQYYYFDPLLRGKDPNGLTPIVVQHEMDHFDGVLMLDKKAKTVPKVSQKSIGRNEPCPCGSGLKYKKCCMGEIV